MSLAGEALSALIAGVEKHASPPPSGAASAGSVADLSPEDQALWSQYWGASVPCEGVTAGAAGAEEATVVDDVVDNAVDNASDGSVAQATAPGTGHLRVDGGENPDIDGQGVGPAEEPGEGETAADQPVEVTLPGGVSVLLYRDETIVELKNGHYFKGKIKNLDEHAITLFYDRGEYTFGMDELEQIVPPGSPEYLPLRHFPDAWVVLANGSRFRGRLIKDDTERIVVGYPSGRLTFRRADVAEVCYLARGDLVVVPDEGAFSK